MEEERSYYTKEEADSLLIKTKNDIISSIDEKNGSYIVDNFGISGQGLVYNSLQMTIESKE